MGVQTSYNYGMNQGVAGGLYDIAAYENNTYTTPGGIPFGYGVVKGPNPGMDIQLPVSSSTAEDFEGVTMNGFTTEQDMSGVVVAGEGQTMGVMKHGNVWVVLGTAANPSYGKTVYLITDGKEAGCFTTENDVATKVLLKAEYLADGDNGLAPVRIHN